MSNYTATVIKTGNSLALRIPKEYALEAHLILGEKVTLSLPTIQKLQNCAKIKQHINKLRELHTEKVQILWSGNRKREKIVYFRAEDNIVFDSS